MSSLAGTIGSNELLGRRHCRPAGNPASPRGGASPPRFQNAPRRVLDIPDQSEKGENLQCVVRNVNLPPEETHVRGSRVVVVVVVPAFSQSDERQKQAVAASVGGFVAYPSEHVAEGVDDKGPVIQERCADKKAPN